MRSGWTYGIKFLVILLSDHHPLLVNSTNAIPPRITHFRFFKMWLQDKSCRELVATIWATNIVGCPMFILAQKLNILKKDLKAWNKNVFGNIHEKVTKAMESEPQSELILALNLEEVYWKEKARVNWHIHGDRNIAFFHKVDKIRQAIKTMAMLKTGDQILTNHIDMANHVLNYYMDLFATTHKSTPTLLFNLWCLNLVFLLDTLDAFGFNKQIKDLIKVTLNSAKLSIQLHKGVRHGYPLSLILFYIAEDVLRKGIMKLLDNNKISSISGPRSIQTTSHVLYADDFIIFCKGVKKELTSLKDYAQASGKTINPEKCKFYTRRTSTRKINSLASLLCFSTGQLPFTYLGVPLFVGKPKKVHLQPITDRILN
ncbi:hypothetical protein Lal_00031244 [Lupinus albus]|nr:hypothetical protein Lal_00031244 [Lupinus albus]